MWGCLFFAVLLFTMGARGDSKLEVRGNTLLPTDDIVRLIGGDLGGEDDERAIKTLQDVYYSEGFLFATFRLRYKSNEEGFILEINEGKQARITAVRVQGASRLTDSEIQRIVGVAPGVEYHPIRISEGIETLLGYYDSIGYPFAQVWLDTLALDDASQSVDISLFVMEPTIRL